MSSASLIWQLCRPLPFELLLMWPSAWPNHDEYRPTVGGASLSSELL